MMSNDDKVIFRCESGTKEGLTAACEHIGISVSMAMRSKAREIINNNSEAIPDDTLFKAKAAQSKDDNKTYQQAAHLPNNLYQETRNMLDTRFPPMPEEIEERYYEPYKEMIELAYSGELKNRKLGQLNHCMHSYHVLHPATDMSDRDTRLDAVVDYAVGVRMDDGLDAAKDFIKSMVQDNVLPSELRDEAFDMTREMSKDKLQEKWKDEWENAVRGGAE